MKKLIPISIFVGIVFLFFFLKVNAIEEELPLIGRVIFVDPGQPRYF